jgi:hypothetical protein
MRRRFSIFATFPLTLFLISASYIVAAQSVAPLLRLTSYSFEESLTSAQREAPPRDPMRTLVGLHLGEAHGPFYIDQVGVLMNADAPRNSFCVRILSEDTLYRAVNAYTNSNEKAAPPLVETHSAFGQQLEAQFKSDAVITRVIAGSKCGGAERGPIVPAVPPGSDRQHVLVVYLNVEGEASTQLMAKGKDIPQATASCAPVTSRIIAYNLICKIPVPPTSPDALKVKILGQPHPEVYTLLWSAQ